MVDRGLVTSPASLSERSLGWLRYLYRKSTTPDSWDRDGEPAPHWDALSEAPMLSWHRFDLLDSCYAVALMAETTPAWREVYARILDELVARHTTWWAAKDWLDQIGEDPDRADYPDIYRMWIPEDLWGSYDVPGWTANGVDPYGVQMDPVAADGNLFFKGFFLVMLGLHAMVTGDGRWNEPFEMVRDGENTFTWTHSGIAEHLAEQWLGRPEGVHCENTKIWPLCLSGAGAGLGLHDRLYGSNFHSAFDRWWPYARENYLNLTGDDDPAMATFYYDPVLDRHHRLPVSIAGLFPALYLCHQRRSDAQRLFEMALTQFGVPESDDPSAVLPVRMTSIAMILAREFGRPALADAFGRLADRDFEPTTDSDRGEFTWGFGYNEGHPRGQHNAMLAAAEATSDGAWTRLFTDYDPSRFAAPTVVGVDFPTLGLRRARWEPENERLSVTTTPISAGARPSDTSFRVTNVDVGRRWVLEIDGAESDAWEISEGEIEINTTVDDHAIELRATSE